MRFERYSVIQINGFNVHEEIYTSDSLREAAEIASYYNQFSEGSAYILDNVRGVFVAR